MTFELFSGAAGDISVAGAGEIYQSESDLGDEPDLHRWRATWGRSWCADQPLEGIRLEAFPVVKVTPQGAWIAEHAWRQVAKYNDDGTVIREWCGTDGPRQWVSNDGGQAWAKRTRAEAIFSLTYRLTRWAPKATRDIRRVVAAIETAEKMALRPGHTLSARADLHELHCYLTQKLQAK